LRLGFQQVNGFKDEEAELLLSGRNSRYKSIQVTFEAGVSSAALERLTDADAFRSIGLDKRQALWVISAYQSTPTWLFDRFQFH
jgi:error-prone DNA polymerase